MKRENVSIMIDLDCLLDMRAAVLFSHDQEKAIQILDDSYYEREQDIFPGYSKEEFEMLYKARTKEVLKNAVFTPIVKLMQEFVIGVGYNSATGPQDLMPKVIVNTFPFYLEDIEVDSLTRTIMALTKESADVEVVYHSPEDLTPSYVKRSLSVLVKYHFLEWLELHSEAGVFKKIICPEVVLYGPALFFGNLPTHQEEEALRVLGATAFEALEAMSAPIISLHLLPVSDFSLSMRVKPVTQTPA